MRHLTAIIFALACGALPHDAAADDRIVLQRQDITVADIAMLNAEQQVHPGGLVVLTIPPGKHRLELDAATRARLLRLRVPGQSLRLRHDGKVQFTLATPDQAIRATAPCFTLRHDLDAGDYLDRHAVEPAPCLDRATTPQFRFDRRVNAPYLSSSLAAGAYLGSLALREGAIIGAGSGLSHVSRQGPVTIERAVTAVQPARAGKAMFVRTQDGAIFASRLAPPEDRASR